MDQQNNSEDARPLAWPEHWPRLRYVMVPAFLALWASTGVIGMSLTGTTFWEAVFQGLSVATMVLVFLPFVVIALLVVLEQVWSLFKITFGLARLLLWLLMAIARKFQGVGR